MKGDPPNHRCSAGMEGSQSPKQLIRGFKREFHAEYVIDCLMCLKKLGDIWGLN